jgi:hypothetical protein
MQAQQQISLPLSAVSRRHEGDDRRHRDAAARAVSPRQRGEPGVRYRLDDGRGLGQLRRLRAESAAETRVVVNSGH